MVLFNHATREMTAKIVYYGPGLCGKTTNLLVIFDKLDPKSRGKMLSLATKTDRTLFFDLLPVDIGKVGSFNLKIQLYTVPGQVFYNETRKLVLRSADAVVFVADSQSSMVDSNRDSFANLLENLEINQLDANDIPIVVQYNKRDIPGVLPVEELQEKLGLEAYPYVEASAVQGEGVMETFQLVSRIAAKHLFERMQGGKPLKKSAAAKTKAAEPEPAAAVTGTAPVEPSFVEPQPEAPFASAPDEASYGKVEEVSLEELLEGRERPATFSGSVPLPSLLDEAEGHDEEVDDVESLEEAHLIEPAVAPEPVLTVEPSAPEVTESPTAAAPSPSPDDSALSELRQRVADLEGSNAALRALLRELAETISRSLGGV